MKARGVLFLCLMVMQYGCQSANLPPSAEASAPPAIQHLVAQARKSLPKNWTVTCDAQDKWVEIARVESVLGIEPEGINAPVGATPKPPAPIRPSLLFHYQAYVPPAAWMERKEDLEERIAELGKKISHPRGKEQMDAYRYAHTEAEKPLVDEHNRLLAELRGLPEYYFENIGLSCHRTDFAETRAGLVEETHRNECRQVYLLFIALLHPYDPSASEALE